MAAPATYIRTIHSSLTSASAHHSHHSPSAWASASASATSATAQYHLNHGHLHLHTLSNVSNPVSNAPIVSGGHPVPFHHQARHASNQVSYGMHTPSISTHNAHMYTHHLRDLTHPASSSSPSAPHRASGAQGPVAPHSAGMVMTQQGQFLPSSGDAALPQHMHTALSPAPRRNAPSPPPHSRRRSSSVRVPPSYRFDPFGDVDDSISSAGFARSGGGGLSSLTASAPAPAPIAATVAAPSEPEAHAQAEATEQEDDIASFSASSNHPYTIHIPPAAPLEIQQYTPPRTPSPAARTLPVLSPRAASFAPTSVSVPKLSSSASALGFTYAPTAPAPANSFPAPNLSKIVAGMLLNRVHGPKPMRRRIVGAGNGGRQYVKSCLSSVVSVEV